jgi:myo-inositol-1-phosphate synthase
MRKIKKDKIKVAIVGIGNCCSALYQGLHYYKNNIDKSGLMSPEIGGYVPKDIEVVLAVDIDKRKVGKHLSEAIFQEPNCCRVFCTDLEKGPIVKMGKVLDGVSEHMLYEDSDRGFRVSKEKSVDLVKELKESKADILINYLPVGSQKATEYLANACLETGVSLLNCIPVFIASDKKWEKKFKDKNIPIIGDDMKSLFGASILSQMFQELAFARGHRVKFHSQVNMGGNTDFNNMMNYSRLKSKKISKENVIKSQNTIRGIPLEKDSVFAGPSSFIPYLKDNKVAHFRLELEGFGGAPVELDCKLKVCDSENSAGVVIDACRYLKVARELGLKGALRGPSAATQKTPPLQLTFEDAIKECELLASRKIPNNMKRNAK